MLEAWPEGQQRQSAGWPTTLVQTKIYQQMFDEFSQHLLTDIHCALRVSQEDFHEAFAFFGGGGSKQSKQKM